MAGIATRTGPDGQLIIETAAGDRFIPQLMDILVSSQPAISLESVNLSRPTLEDVFIKLTGHAIRATEADATDHLRAQARVWGGGRRR
jgi:ABC-2 type transport system ATP-binding protein